jgi:transposase InsO family protein
MRYHQARIERRFDRVNRVPVTIEWLSDNGSCYIAGNTRSFARDIGRGCTEAKDFFAHHSSPSDLPPVRASLRNIVKVLMNSRTGTAGEPIGL